MVLVNPTDNLIACQTRQKLGLAYGYGGAWYGKSKYGYHDLRAGIYRVISIKGHQKNQKMKFYRPPNPSSELQITWQEKYAAGVLAWQSLTAEQKAVYNKRAIGLSFFGYHLFLREYLKS